MYFPKSQIKSNLYTNGGEYILSTTKESYVGYYYETSKGTTYTGKTPQDGPNIILIKPINITNPTNSSPTDPITYALEGNKGDIGLDPNEYFNLKPTPRLQERSLPQYNPTLPTQKDISLGVFQRFFCKKNNELIYMEINQSTYSQLKAKSSQIAWDLYTPIDTLWYMKGDREKVYNTNKNLISLIEQKQKWYGFSQYFKEDFSKYYVGE
jgi:hypothetical protein